MTRLSVLLLIIVFSSSVSFSQELNDKEKEEIKTVCENFVLNLSSYVNSEDTTNAGFINSMSDSVRIYYEHYQEYISITNSTFKIKKVSYEKVINTDGWIGCQYDNLKDTTNFICNVRKENEQWKVFAFGGIPINATNIESVKDAIEKEKLRIADEPLIKEAIELYYTGLDDKKIDNSIEKIKKYATENAYLTSVYKLRYDSITYNGYQNREPKRRFKDFEFEDVEYQNDSVAYCRTKIGRVGTTTVVVCKENGEWKFAGEMREIMGEEDVEKQKKKLENMYVSLELRKVVDQFRFGWYEFMTTGNSETIESLTSKGFFDFMMMIHHLSGEFENPFLHPDKGNVRISDAYKDEILKDSVVYDLSSYGKNNTLHLIKIDGKWIISGFQGKSGKELNINLANRAFYETRNLWGFSYSPWIKSDPDTNVIESWTEIEQPIEWTIEGKEPNYIDHNLEYQHTYPMFDGGWDAFESYIAKNLKYPKEALKKKVEGIVYVDFIITEEGKIVEPKVIYSDSPLLNDEALRMVIKMPDWIPAKSGNIPHAMRRCVGISFVLP